MLIEDGTYFVAVADDIIIGCGGWSKHKTLFGGDQFSNRNAGLLDPRFEAAKIRAFFVHPNFARQGIGRAILDRCEVEAARKGFISLELMSTLPGVEFYIACGYVATDPIFYDAPCATKIRADEESFAGIARVLGGREYSGELEAARSVRHTREGSRVFISAPRQNTVFSKRKSPRAKRRLVLYYFATVRVGVTVL